jgi:tagatose 1,6-diphosphate aldolase
VTRALTPGKEKGLDAVADARGVIAALAIDQRGAMRALFGKAMNVSPDVVSDEKLVQYKEAVSRVLTSHASAILLDPEYGLPAARLRAKNAGLLLAYEKTGYDKAVKGRLPALLERWSAQRLIDAGADSVKLLLYYAPSSAPAINDAKHAFVERVGAECAACDVPFFLEIVNYGEGMEDKSEEFARLKPDVVAQSMTEFSKPRYRVDVLKVGVPVNMDFVEGSPSATGKILYSRKAALDYYRAASYAASTPFIYLSQGVSNETFQYALELATEAKVPFSGVLCGRATWKDGVSVLVKDGENALNDWLAAQGVRNIENVNLHLRSAVPWHGRWEGHSDGKSST